MARSSLGSAFLTCPATALDISLTMDSASSEGLLLMTESSLSSPNCSKAGVFYIEMTTYIEGLKHDVTDGALDEEISLSVFCFPSPNPV